MKKILISLATASLTFCTAPAAHADIVQDVVTSSARQSLLGFLVVDNVNSPTPHPIFAAAANCTRTVTGSAAIQPVQLVAAQLCLLLNPVDPRLY